MPKRTSPLLILFLAGCPKEPDIDPEKVPEPDQFRFAQEMRLAAPKPPIPIELYTGDGGRTGARTSSTPSELTIALPEPSPSGARLSVMVPRDSRIERVSARIGDAWRDAGDPEAADLPWIPIVQAEPRFAPFLPAGTNEVIVAFRPGPRPALQTVGAPRRIDSLLVVLDASASAARDWERRIELARALVEALDPKVHVHIGTFDQVYQRLYEGEIAAMKPEAWQRLGLWRALGASNYWQMFASVASGEASRTFAEKFSQMVVIGDGMITAGLNDPQALLSAAQQTSVQGVKRIDVIAMGEARHHPFLRALVGAAAEQGALIDGDLPLPQIGRYLSHTVGPVAELATDTATAAPAFLVRSASQPAPSPKKEKLAPVAVPEHAREQIDGILAAHDAAPFDPIALLDLGDAYAAINEASSSARAYGSLVDLFPAEPHMLQLAAIRMAALPEQGALRQAIDTFDRALRLSPGDPASHRMLAMSLLRAQQEQLAFGVVERATKVLPPGPAQVVLRDDAALIAAAWVRKEPAKRAEIGGRLAALGRTITNQPSLTFALYWSGDIDVDLVVLDAKHKRLPVHADAGAFGPEIAGVLREARHRAYPYRAEAHVFGKPALGVTAGTLEILEHDGRGGFWFVSKSFLLKEESGIVEIETVAKPFGKGRGGS